ncbi:hypothetical protein AK88_00386 [Plasmodium fragile]|uniref:Uncharacterized protein n=1 Tax=Plasmodium fragile TaxID=5857 RepID=A0A0D9QS46_PLAFR|nr:uncharacterized protein AK88_00386 [Plasmodium fragile]KJP89930.1 hypothetical protein AK88_00386 [Plasmodium fragile]
MNMYSMDGSLIARNVNMMIMHTRSLLSRLPKPFTLSVYAFGVLRISPRSYKLLQDILLENVLGNHFEHVQGRHYKGRDSLNANKLHAEVHNTNQLGSNRGRRVKDLDVRLHFLHVRVEIQNDFLHSRMNYLFAKFVFARTVRYLGEENMVTYVKGIVPLVMNTFYHYPYDILMCHTKLNPRKYAKWLARMNQSYVEHNYESFNCLLKTKLRKYERVKRRERKTFHVMYKRIRQDQLGCHVTNHVSVKMERIYLNMDILQLFNLYTFYFVDDRNLHLSRVEKVFRGQGHIKLCAREPFSQGQQLVEEQLFKKGHSAHNTWTPHQTSMETLKLESIKNAPPEEPLERRIVRAYQRMVKKLSSSDFSNYNSVARSNNVYTVQVQMRHVHCSFNFLFYENVLGVRKLPLGGRRQKGIAKEETNGTKQLADGQSHPFGLTYKGNLNFLLSFNLRKSIMQKFAKKEKYIFFNNYVVDNFFQNHLNKSGKLANFVSHAIDHIGDEMDEHIYFKCDVERKNYLYLTNREGSYCISRNINLCVSVRNDKVIYFNCDEKNVKMEGLHYREVFLDNLLRRSSSYSEEDDKSAQEKKILCDVQLWDNNGLDLRKGNSNSGASTTYKQKDGALEWERAIGVKHKHGPQHRLNFTSPTPPSTSVDVGKNSIHMETPCAKPKYIDVHVKKANFVIKLPDLFYLCSKLYEVLYIMNRHEEVNVCLFKLSEASLKKKDIHKCKIKRMKIMNYSTFIVRVVLSSLDLHVFESVYYRKLKKCKKSKISHVHVQANYEYLTCHRKNETLFKRHQSDMSLQINFAKNNIYEEFTRGMRLKVICIRTRKQGNLIVLLEEQGVNIFLTKNAFRIVLRLYEEANDWRNYRAREVAHRGCYPNGGSARGEEEGDQITDPNTVRRCSTNPSCDTHNEASRAQSRRIQRSRRNYEQGGRTHNCAKGEDKAGGSTIVRKTSSKLRTLLRSKHYNFPHDDYAVMNRTYERVATYRSSEISHSPFDRSNPVHMLYVRQMESFIFPSLTSKWSGSGELVLSCDHSLYVVSSPVCIYNDTNYDMVLLINNQRIVLFAKRHNYLSRHRCNMKRDHFVLILFYKKGLFISSKLSLQEFKSANLVGKEKLHQFMAHKKYFACRLRPDRRTNSFLCRAAVKLVPLRRVRNTAQSFLTDEGRNCANGGGDASEPSKQFTREFPPTETPPSDFSNQYTIYNCMRRKLAKTILNDEFLCNNWSSSDDCILTNLTVIQNEKTDDGSLYLNISQMAKVRNTLPIRVHYRSGNTLRSVKPFSSQEIFSNDLDLNLSWNTLRGSRMNITYDKRLGFSPLGDLFTSPTTTHHLHNNEVKEEFPPQRSSAQMEGFNLQKQRHEDITEYHVNVIKWNKEIIITCHTLICLYSYELKNVEVNRKRIYFVHSSRGVSSGDKCHERSFSSPLTFPLKRLNLYVGVYNELVSSIHVENYKISSVNMNSFKEVKIGDKHRGRECSSHYALEYIKNGSLGSSRRYSRVSSLLIIYPRFVMLNQTNFNVVMSSSCSSDAVMYTFERRSRSVINLLENDKRSFFFQIGKSHASNNDYVFVSGGIDITKEGSYILCFTNRRSSSSKSQNLPQNGDKNHLHKSGKREKIKTQFLHLKIKIIQGSKLKEQSGVHWGSNSLFIIISNHRRKKDKMKKYLTKINSPNVLMHSMESNEKENTLMNIYHFIKEEEQVKKLYVYNDMEIDLMFDVFHFSEFVHMIKKVLEQESTACTPTHADCTAHQKGIERRYEKGKKGTVDHRCASQVRQHNRAKESFFRNIFLIESSDDNSSADELIEQEQNTNYDTAKLTKQNVSYISNHVNELKKFVQVNLRQLRRIGRKKILLFPLRKNKNVKNSFLVVYPWRHAKTYQIVKFSLKRKKHVLTFTRNCASGTPPDDPPLVIILETFVLSKKGKKKKILLKISKHIDNIVHIRGKVNMNTLFKPGIGTPRMALTHGEETTAVVKPLPAPPHHLDKVNERGSDPYRSLPNKQINILHKYATVAGSFVRRKRGGVGNLLSVKGTKRVIGGTTHDGRKFNRGAYPKRLHTKGRPLQHPTYCHFKNKNVTLVESRNKYKVIFTKREKGTPDDALHFYLSIAKSIRINVFSTVLVEGSGEGRKLFVERGEKWQGGLGSMPNDTRLHTMTHSSQRDLFKKKKNSHLCTLMLKNTNMLVSLHQNMPNVILVSLGDAIIKEFASADMKKVLCKYEVKGGQHRGEGYMTLERSEGVCRDNPNSINCLARLHMEYEIYRNEWNIKKFDLAFSPVHVQVTLDVVENFSYCYEKFWRGEKTPRSRKVVEDDFQFFFSTKCGNSSGESVSPICSLPDVRLPRIRNSGADLNRASNHRSIYHSILEGGKKKKLKIGTFQVSTLNIHLSFHKENTCSIYEYKNKGPCKLAVRLTYLNDMDDADVTISPLCLTRVRERDAQDFLNYLFNFYMKELYKGLFFYLTRMNLVNKYISNYYSFFHVLMDSAIFNVDHNSGVSAVGGVDQVSRVSDVSGVGTVGGVRGQAKHRHNRRHTSLTSACLRGRRQDDSHVQVEDHRNISSDSNFYVRTKKREIEKKLNTDLFYLENGKRMSLFEENGGSNCIAGDTSHSQGEEQQSAEGEHQNNFSLLNNTLRTLGKDIMSSINYYLYDGATTAATTSGATPCQAGGDQRGKSHQADGTTFFKAEKMNILKHFLETRTDPPAGGEVATKTDEEFPSYLSLYRRNKIMHDEYVPRVCSSVDRRLIRNLVVLDYLHDKQERNLLLFCDEYLVMFHRNKRTIMRKQNMIKVEITCVHFNLTFDRDKSLIMNLRNVIKKNKDNFLGFYFDVLFKRKKKRLIKKIKKKLNKIVYFLYYLLYFIHNYQRKVKLLKGTDAATGKEKKNVNSFVTIFEEHQKVFFSFSSLAHLARFYLNMRALVFNMSASRHSS